MNFAEIINLLAAPHDVQRRYLMPVSDNATSPDFVRDNNISRMLLVFSGSCDIYEGGDGTEGREHWLERTQLPHVMADDRQHPVWRANGHLATAINMMEELGRDHFYCAHGLRSAPEWRLIRHLANQVRDASDWPHALIYPGFTELWEALGAGVIECPR